MSYTVATVPNGFGIIFPTEKTLDVCQSNGYTHLLEPREFKSIEEAISELNSRNEEIEHMRSSSLFITSQGLNSIINYEGDMNHILAALTKFICQSLSNGAIGFSQADQMIDIVMNHMDNIAESQSETFKHLFHVEEVENYEVYDDDERV